MRERGREGISVTLDRELQAHVFRLAGELSVEDVIKALGPVYRSHDPSTALNLLFMDDGLTTLPTQRELVEILHFAMENRPSCSGRTALVAATDASYGIFRMVEGIGGDSFDHQRAFRTLVEAREWISGSQESSGAA